MALNSRISTLIFPVLILALLLMLPVVKPLFYSKEHRAARKAYDAHRKSVLRAWEDASFRVIEPGDDFDAAVAEAVRNHAVVVALNRRQRDDLVRAVGSFIHAHNRLDWDHFQDYRLPLSAQSTQFDAQLMAQYKRMLPSRSEFREAISSPPEEAEEFSSSLPSNPFYKLDTPWNTFRTYWQLFVGYAYDPDSKKPIYCCWQSVALEGLQMAVTKISEGPNPRGLNYEALTNATPASFTMATSVRYRPSLEELLSKGKKVTTLTLSMLVRDDHQATPYPVHVGFYWHSSHNHWLPFALELVGQPRASMKYFF